MNHRPGIRPVLALVAACASITAGGGAGSSLCPSPGMDSSSFYEPNRRGPTNAREFGEQLRRRRRRK